MIATKDSPTLEPLQRIDAGSYCTHDGQYIIKRSSAARKSWMIHPVGIAPRPRWEGAASLEQARNILFITRLMPAIKTSSITYGYKSAARYAGKTYSCRSVERGSAEWGIRQDITFAILHDFPELDPELEDRNRRN